MSLIEILKKGVTSKHTASGTSNYQYTLNTTEVGTHLTRVNSGGSVWQNNPSSWGSTVDLIEGTGNTLLSNFDSGWDGWNPHGEGASGGSWVHKSGSTPTANTGPTHAVSGSYYFYTEVDGATNSVFSLEKPIVPPRPGVLAVISFYYFMYGADMGSLKVDVKVNTSWITLRTITGEQHKYTSARAGVPNRPYQLEPYTPPISAPYNPSLGSFLYLTEFLTVAQIADISSVRFLYTSTAGVRGDCAIDSVALGFNPIAP